jgi:hypothetical protein
MRTNHLDGIPRTEVQYQSSPLAGRSREPGDCDDACLSCLPGGVETCDGRSIWTDRDGDGFGDPATEREHCELPPGHAENGDDCDDSNAEVNPAATEICNGIDDDCDGEPDDGLVLRYYPDRDGDGFGSSEDGIETCNPSPGMVSDSTDCDDTLFDINPDAIELPDGLDNDCDGEVDEGFEGDAGTDSDLEQIVRQEGGCQCSFTRSSSPMTRWLLWLAPDLFTLLNNIGSTSVDG